MVQHPVVVITFAEHQGLKILVNIPANGFHFRKIHWGAGYRGNLPRGNGYLVRGRIMAGIQPYLLVQHIPAVMARQIKIAVVGKVGHGVCVTHLSLIHISLSIKCKIVSADRKRVTATYTGSLSKDGGAYPVSLFYTNTVNLLQAQDLGFDDFTDAYTMAGYVLSDDVKFNGISSDVEAAVLEYRSSLDIDTLTRIFDGADFPLASETQWPESFS